MNNETILKLAKKLHQWQWESCQEILPKKHSQNIPEWDSLHGDQCRIYLKLAEKVLTNIKNI